MPRVVAKGGRVVANASTVPPPHPPPPQHRFKPLRLPPSPTRPHPAQKELLEQFIDLDTLSKLISYAIITGSAIVKIPQIVNVLKAKSARGLNLNAIYLETVATLLGTCYNLLMGNPFRTYGETALILFQNIIIVLLVWSFSAHPVNKRIVAASVFVGLAAALWNAPAALTPVWPAELSALGVEPLNSMYNSMTLLYVCARVRRGWKWVGGGERRAAARGAPREGVWVYRRSLRMPLNLCPWHGSSPRWSMLHVHSWYRRAAHARAAGQLSGEREACLSPHVLCNVHTTLLTSTHVIPPTPPPTPPHPSVPQVPQILQNFKQGHTGVLSIITTIMNTGGNLARIATSLKEGLALVVIGGFVLNLCLNAVLLLQILFFWKATSAALAKKETKKKA
jgi:hypothetical protein